MIAHLIIGGYLEGEQIGLPVVIKVLSADVALCEPRVDLMLVIHWDAAISTIFCTQHSHMLISEHKEFFTLFRINMKAVAEDLFIGLH